MHSGMRCLLCMQIISKGEQDSGVVEVLTNAMMLPILYSTVATGHSGTRAYKRDNRYEMTKQNSSC